LGLSMSNKKKKKIKLRGVIRLFIILLAISLLIIKIVEWNSVDEDQVYLARSGEISIEESYTGIVVRREYVYKANFPGTVSQAVNDGEKVKKNQRVLNITREQEQEAQVSSTDMTILPSKITQEEVLVKIKGLQSEIAQAIKVEAYDQLPDLKLDLALQLEILQAHKKAEDSSVWVKGVGDASVAIGENVPIQTQRGGIISFYVDNYEEVFTYDQVMTNRLGDYLDHEILPRNISRESVTRGDVLYKIIDDNDYFIIIVGDKSLFSQYERNDSVEVMVGLEEVTGTVESFIPLDDQVGVAIKVTEYLEDFYKKRFMDVTIKQDDYKGLLVKSTSLTRLGESYGVYVLDSSGTVRFKPVSVIQYQGSDVLVESDFYFIFDQDENKKVETISANDRIIKNAELYKDGDKIK